MPNTEHDEGRFERSRVDPGDEQIADQIEPTWRDGQCPCGTCAAARREDNR